MAEENQTEEAAEKKPIKKRRLREFLKTKKGKIVAGVVVLLVVAGILLAIPATRYGLYGQVIKKDVTVEVLDNKTNRPVGAVKVTIDQMTVTTGSDGKAVLRGVTAGPHTIQLSKDNYEAAAVPYTVGLFASDLEVSASLTATGRQVELTVLDAVSSVPLEGVTLSGASVTAKTDNAGKAFIVLPITNQKQTLKLSRHGYNDKNASINVDLNRETQSKQLELTPAGTVMYLSKATGKINVMRANLDGSDATVLVKGTGNEDEWSTTLLAARDWKYAALLASRTPRITAMAMATAACKFAKMKQ